MPGLHATLDEHALELALAHSQEAGDSPSLLLKRGPVGLGAAGTHQLGKGGLGEGGLARKSAGGRWRSAGGRWRSAGGRWQRCRRWRTIVRGVCTGEGEGILEGLPPTKTALDRSDGAALHCLGQCSPA